MTDRSIAPGGTMDEEEGGEPQGSPLELLELPRNRRAARQMFAELRDYAAELEQANAGLRTRVGDAGDALLDMDERLRRVAAERDDATLKGERAARLLLDSLVKEKAERVASVECMAQTLALVRSVAGIHLDGRELVNAAIGGIDLALHELEMGS